MEQRNLHGPRIQERGSGDLKNSSGASPADRLDLPKIHVVEVTDIETTAAKIFARCRYAGSNGQTLWKAAAAFKVGLITESALASAVTAVSTLKPNNPPAYFRTVLAEKCGLSMGELSDLMRRVRISPVLPDGPPARPPERSQSQQPQKESVFNRPPPIRSIRTVESEMNATRNEYLNGAHSQ
jgi:hypothetical protein